MSITVANDFLKTILGKDVNQTILLYNKNQQSLNSPMLSIIGTRLHNKLLTANRYNSLGHDIYYIPNIGGTKKSDILSLVSCYVDLDAGREGGKYLPLKKVKQWKNKVTKYISSLQPNQQPNLIVDTRNGYQLYWLLQPVKNSVLNNKLWQHTQSKLYSLFADYGADSKCLKENQILRVPGLKWYKKSENLPAYDVTYKAGHNNRYMLKSLFSSLSNVTDKKKRCGWSSAKQQVKDYYGSADLTKLQPEQVYRHICNPSLGSKTITYQTTLSDCIDLLNELETILKFSNHKYLAKQCNEMAKKLVVL